MVCLGLFTWQCSNMDLISHNFLEYIFKLLLVLVFNLIFAFTWPHIFGSDEPLFSCIFEQSVFQLQFLLREWIWQYVNKTIDYFWIISLCNMAIIHLAPVKKLIILWLCWLEINYTKRSKLFHNWIHFCWILI